jgi:hypothetical protein
MNDIPDFANALDQFQGFLARMGLPSEVFWVFREDMWRVSREDIRIKFPVAAKNINLAQKVFAEGRERGLVQIAAVAIAGNKIAATVWFPKYPDEEIQGWSQGMKLSIWEPRPHAKVFNGLHWRVLSFLPSFRQCQQREMFIGTKQWAAA